MEVKNVNQEEIFNNLLVMLFNEILDVEQKALITGSFKEISINDMHIIDAIGVKEPKNMGNSGEGHDSYHGNIDNSH